MIQLHDYMDNANVLDSDDWLDYPDDLLPKDQEAIRDDKEKQPRYPRITLDEELAAEAILLAAVPGKTEKLFADTGSTTNAMRLKDVHLTQEDRSLKRLKRDLRLEALRRLEVSARYPWEFQRVIDTWNLLDANRQRMQREHELLRGNVPIDHGTDSSTVTIFPRYLNDPIRRQVQCGRFEDALADCVDTMQDFTTKEYARAAVCKLIRSHRESLYLLYIKLIPVKELAMLRGSSLQAVYRAKDTMLLRLREAAHEALSAMQVQGIPLTKTEHLFLAQFTNSDTQKARKEADE